MEYSNPEIPEGINTSKAHPLKEFFILTSGIILLVITFSVVLILIVDFFADKIPFVWEKEIPVERILGNKNSTHLPEYLEQVSNNVIKHISLPADMNITVHYVNDDTVNAFATLGGHIILYRGLLEKLTYEDELAAIIAHEIAHIKYRHPILSISHGAAVGLALSVVGSSTDNISNSVISGAGMMTMMKFSREYEYQADEQAVEALVSIYAHADGALSLFEFFKADSDRFEAIEFLNTHPLSDNRISHTREIIGGQSIVKKTLMKPLPDSFVSWLISEKANQHNE